MATWMVHLRIADYFIDNIKGVKATEFVIGSVAPDCGYGKKDSIGAFNPPPAVTHWTPTGNKKDCRYMDFYNQYLKDAKMDSDYWFYLGYYVHLLTDIMWSATVYMPTREKYAAEYEKNPEFLKEIKVDWNDLDHKYLCDNPDFRALKILSDNKYVKDYMPYYEENQLTVQTRYIANYYKENMRKSGLDREYTYLKQEDMDNFIECAKELIKMDLKNKQLI